MLGYAWAFIIPLLVLIGSLSLKWAAGPLWLYPDTSYFYLANSLTIVQGFEPRFMGQPGLPLQLLGAWLMAVFNVGKHPSVMVNVVLASPEFYLSGVYFVILLGIFLSVVILAIDVYRQTQSRLLALMAQLPVLCFLAMKSFDCSAPVVPVLANVSQEAMMVPFLCLFNMCLFRCAWSGGGVQRKNIFLLGTVMGTATAVKITFMPLIVLFGLMLRGRYFLLLGLISCGVFLLWMSPVLGQVKDIVLLISNILTHTGYYGAGPAEKDLNCYLYSSLSLMFNYWPISLGAIILCYGSLYYYRHFSRDKELCWIAAASLTVLLDLLVVAKHPAQRYLMPGIGLTGGVLVMSVRFLLPRYPWIRVLAIGAMGLCSVLAVGSAINNGAGLMKQRDDVFKIRRTLAEKYAGCSVVAVVDQQKPYLAPEYALSLADAWVWGREIPALMRLYPSTLTFEAKEIWKYNRKLTMNDLLRQNACVLITGPEFNFEGFPHKVQTLEIIGENRIYKVVSSTEGEANWYFGLALMKVKERDWYHAMLLALRARERNFQPKEKLDDLIRLINKSRLSQ